MKAVILWVKSNPILVFAAVLCVLALGTLVVVHLDGAKFKGQMTDRGRTIDKIKQLEKISADLPSEKVDGQPRTVEFTVNPSIIDVFQDIYGGMADEYRKIRETILARNEYGLGGPTDVKDSHIMMKEGVFPDPGEKVHLLYDARGVYRDAFTNMLKAYSKFAQYPRLDAGGPMNLWDVGDELARVQDEYLHKSLFTKELAELTEQEFEELSEQKRRRVLELMQLHASRIHIYAQKNPQDFGFPFEIGAWSLPGTLPSLAHVWEGQMGLWIQQDIVQAIAMANHVDDPAANVMTAPVKRLLSVQVGNEYVGLQLQQIGAGDGNGDPKRSGGRRPRAERRASKRDSGGDDKPAGGYAKSPTGRTSNDIYDVRYVRVEAIVDWERIYEFIDSLAQTNYMTVLKMDIQDIDEYEALREGYMYGKGDAVHVSMIIESLWFREWTTRWMPKRVKLALGIKVEQQQQEDQDNDDRGKGRRRG